MPCRGADGDGDADGARRGARRPQRPCTGDRVTGVGRGAGRGRRSDGTSLRRATAVMAVGTTLSRATGVLRIFALTYALGTLSLADSYNLANTMPNIVHDIVLGGILAATFVPVFVQRLTTRADDEAWDAVSAVVSVTMIVIAVASLLFLIAVPVHHRRHHGAQPRRPGRPEPRGGQGPAVPVRAPAHLLRVHQRGHRPAQRPAEVRGADVHAHRQQRRAHRRAARVRHHGAPTPRWRAWPPTGASCCSSGLGTTAGVMAQAGLHDPEPAAGRAAPAVAARLPPRGGAHHPAAVGVDLRAGGGQPAGAAGGPGPVREGRARGGERPTPTPTSSSSCPTASWRCRS